MQCYVYKGSNRDDHFLYLPCVLSDEIEDELPPALLKLLGDLQEIVSFELSAEKTLAQADAAQVINDIQSQGYYLQMPKKDMSLEEDRYFN